MIVLNTLKAPLYSFSPEKMSFEESKIFGMSKKYSSIAYYFDESSPKTAKYAQICTDMRSTYSPPDFFP
jgi:hypothetical protein